MRQAKDLQGVGKGLDKRTSSVASGDLEFIMDTIFGGDSEKTDDVISTDDGKEMIFCVLLRSWLTLVGNSVIE